MLKISDTKIYLTRGDSAYITLQIINNGKPYTLHEGDIISCQVRNRPNDGDLLFKGQIDIVRDEIVWHIRPEDTKHAEVGTYYYDAQVETANGDVFTFITSSVFKLTDEVTFGEH